MELIAKTFEGLEDLLKEEIIALGGTNVQAIKRAVKFEGDKNLMYRVNLEARTALRVLKPLFSFTIHDQEDYYDEIYKYDWQSLMHQSDTLAIDCVSRSHVFRHSKFAVYRAKDAICDFFNDKFDERPSIDVRDPKYRLHVFIKNEDVSIYLDSSGSSLHLRGYRKFTGEAPLNEVLSAGIVMLSDWDKKSPLLDPMCGSGTILIEAARIAMNYPCNINRTFNFMNWNDFDAPMWQSIKQDALDAAIPLSFELIGNDNDELILESAELNIKAAGLEGKIKLVSNEFMDYKPELNEMTVIFNPPYEIRITTGDIFAFYKMMGDTFKNNYAGCSIWFISANLEAIKSVRLKTSLRIRLFNGANDSRLVNYKMYRGTKRIKIEENND